VREESSAYGVDSDPDSDFDLEERNPNDMKCVAQILETTQQNRRLQHKSGTLSRRAVFLTPSGRNPTTTDRPSDIDSFVFRRYRPLGVSRVALPACFAWAGLVPEYPGRIACLASGKEAGNF